MKTYKLIISICLLASTVFGVDKVLKSVPERTSLIAKIDLDTIKKIPFVKSFVEDSSNIKISELRSAIQAYAGLDILKIQQLWVVAGTENEFIFIARGGFDTLPVEQALRKLNKYGAMKVDGVHFAGMFDDQDNPGKKNLIAILDDKTVIVAQPKFGQEYLDIFSGKKNGLGTNDLRTIEKVEKSKYLVHAKSINLYIPEKDKANPVLGNMESGELIIKESSKYLQARLETEAKDKKNVKGLAFILNGFINGAKENKDPNQNPIVREGIENAKITSTNTGIVMQTKFSLTTLELLMKDQLNGLEAIFE